MLKRYQVLLPDWLGDYIKTLVDRYDLSFSEVIRVEVCLSILSVVTNMFPEYKPGIKPNEIYDLIKKQAEKEMERDEAYRILSNIYFETRKAIEYRSSKEKTQKKK
jgi:hypothetical protein